MQTLQMYEKLAEKPKNKHLYTLGFTGKCKRTGKLYVGRVELFGQNSGHVIKRAIEFYEPQFSNLEVYGVHLANNRVV